MRRLGRWPMLAHLWLVIPAAAVVWLVLPTLGAGFGFVDDHEIVALASGDLPASQWWQDAFEFEAGRFRPGYYALRFAEVRLWGDNAGGWYAARLFLALATAAGIVALARLPAIPSIAVVLIPFAAGEAFYRLGPQEAYTIPMFVWGLVLIRTWPGIALLIGAGLTKESFAVVLPLVAAWAWWRDRWTPQVVALAAGAVILPGMVALSQASGDVYGLVRTQAMVRQMAGRMAGPFLTTLFPTLIGAIYAPRPVALALIAFVSLLVTQAVVYGGFLAPEARYLAVVAIGAVIVAAAGFRAMPRWLMTLVAIPVLIGAGTIFSTQHDEAEWWAFSAAEFQRSIATARDHRGALIVTGGDPQSEQFISVRRYLAGHQPEPGTECAEVILVEGGETGICPIVFVIRGHPNQPH